MVLIHSIVWGLLAASTSAWALPTDGTLHDLKHTVFGPKENAPSEINGFSQTTDGYLWLGGSSGLFRFDGTKFERVELRTKLPLPVSVYSTFAPDSGGLWIGFTLGGLAFLKDGKLTFYEERDGLPAGSVKSVREDQQGRLWVATTTGLAWLDANRWHRVTAEEGFTEDQAQSVFVDSAGTVWVGCRSKILFLPKGETQFRDTGIVPGLGDEAFAESPNGELVFTDQNDMVYAFKNNPSNHPITRANGGSAGTFDRDGTFWGTSFSSQRFRIVHLDNKTINGTDHFPDGLSQDEVGLEGVPKAVLEDRDGNVWYASASGLERFSVKNVERVSPFPKGADPFTGLLTGLVAADGGGVWLPVRQLRLWYFDKTGGQPAPLKDITCSLRTGSGEIWFGGTGSLWKYSDRQFEKILLPQGAGDREIQAMTVDKAHELWVSIVRVGVFHQTSTGWSAYGDLSDLPRLPAVAMATDTQQRIWFSYADGRVAMLDGSKVSLFSDANLPPTGTIKTIYSRGPHVWFGGDRGLATFDGTGFQAMTSSVKGRFDNITGIVETANGDLWINSSAGIIHVGAEEVHHALTEPNYKIWGELFDTADGVEGDSARLRPLPTAIEGTDGRLWFVRSIGLYVIRPDHLLRQTKPPNIFVDALQAADKTYTPNETIRLPKNSRSININYVGVNLTHPERVRYRYKLDDVDPDWQYAETRRQAFYTNLPPGHHLFHVTASNDDGVWTEPEATLDFYATPTFVETPWFPALCVALGAITLWLLIRLRIRRVSALLQSRLQERLDERERIARELHDTLLQGTQALVLSVEAAFQQAQQAQAKGIEAVLQTALKRADAVIIEGRDRIQDLRLTSDLEADLESAFANLGSELSETSSANFEVLTEGTPRPLLPAIRYEIYRIGREGLLNAFQHAHATEILVQLTYAHDEFRMRIQDNGTGLDEAALTAGSRPGHWGLPGMRERAKKIGGVLEIHSQPQVGTKINFSIAGRLAFLVSQRKSFWRAWW